MFRLTLVLFSLTFCFNSLLLSQAKYDALVKRFLFDLKREDIQKPSDAFRMEYDITVFHGELTVGALAQVNSNDALPMLRELGVYVVSNAGSIYTLRIPLNKVDLVLSVGGIERIEIGSSLSLDMERELQSARVDSVHNNWGDLLDQPYFGTGVVVGIIDWGFDYTHPNFFDKSKCVSDNDIYRHHIVIHLFAKSAIHIFLWV